MCARCDMPLRDGDDFTTHSVDSPTGGGITVHLHTNPCRRTQQQTAPLRGWMPPWRR